MQQVIPKVGNLYSSPNCYLLLFPNKEALERFDRACYLDRFTANKNAELWSLCFRKSISVVDNNTPFLVLNITNDPLNSMEKNLEVLVGERRGWLIFHKSFKEIM